MTAQDINLPDRLAGLLLGTAVGDALGLPSENLSPERIHRRWKGEWRMRFVLGRGMFSDDTEHTLMVAQALLAHPDDAAAFQRALGWKLRWWFAGLPGGVGLATAKACLKLWLGFPPGKSAVTSGGSGPAMRSAILGAWFAHDAAKRQAFVLASARITHRGWQSETGALAVAEAAAWAVQCEGTPNPAHLLAAWRVLSIEPEWQTLLARMESSLQAGDTVAAFIAKLGLNKGVTGYALHVVPAALYAWLRHPGDYRGALIAVLECGGDTDTTGAITGALAGASNGTQSIPAAWTDNLAEWPRSRNYICRLAGKMAGAEARQPVQNRVRCFWPGIILRNLFFLLIVLVHGLRRLFP